MKPLIEQIPYIKNCKEMKQIHKGLSLDRKYLVQMADTAQKLLLRLFDLKELPAKKEEYAILQKMQKDSIKCSVPLAIGELDNQGYLITSYIEGEDAKDEIVKYSSEEQFQIGVEAGRELKKIHRIIAPEQITSWYTRKAEKHQNYINAYLTCGVKVKNDEKLIRFIDENIHLMKNRSNLLQHDDYHLDNIIVQDKSIAGIIDFERFDWGDPIHEFLKIGIFSSEISIPFSIGQIKGYFNGDPDEAFWKLYSLYLAMCVFSSVIWTINVIPHDLPNMPAKMDRFLTDHDYFDQIMPSWYK
ncbi:aminoglycoside phosphotransferase family protein [Gracilibacillus sp. S3-1-1]|uniref:Aminoglycoside phosphotransferase family protein n=1 Tax=Gracilibacillus pellucidus TaxID=3095368 RepID=A0ACC6M899_9BACI|nr:aminoglycoside phosphotransferase family protein [Gracilibacillus sp. S3-1-1]MDX8047215.1 aminoglycoside phosphotransferase family protein [Gracilibacillus sp. S3-1-1]